MNRLHCDPDNLICIIGMGCRFPQATDLDGLWCLLREGKDAIQEIALERWDVNAYYDPDSGKRGKMNIRWGGFLKNLDLFDAQFFGISPREAMHLDPRQRL